MHTDRRLSELGRIVESQQDRLFRFAYMRVGNRPDAEDIVQDVFLKLFRSGERLSHVRSLGHYLLRCVDNGCRDYFRLDTAVPLDIDAEFPQGILQFNGPSDSRYGNGCSSSDCILRTCGLPFAGILYIQIL